MSPIVVTVARGAELVKQIRKIQFWERGKKRKKCLANLAILVFRHFGSTFWTRGSNYTFWSEEGLLWENLQWYVTVCWPFVIPLEFQVSGFSGHPPLGGSSILLLFFSFWEFQEFPPNMTPFDAYLMLSYIPVRLSQHPKTFAIFSLLGGGHFQ